MRRHTGGPHLPCPALCAHVLSLPAWSICILTSLVRLCILPAPVTLTLTIQPLRASPTPIPPQLYPTMTSMPKRTPTTLTPLLIPKRSRLCACGSTLGLGMDYFCSTACARADALRALSAAPSHYRSLVAVAPDAEPSHWRIVRGVLYETPDGECDGFDIPSPRASTSTSNGRARRSSGVFPSWRCSPGPIHPAPEPEPERASPTLKRVKGTVARLRTTLRAARQRAASALPRVSRSPSEGVDDVMDAVRAFERQMRFEDIRERYNRRAFELDSDEEW